MTLGRTKIEWVRERDGVVEGASVLQKQLDRLLAGLGAVPRTAVPERTQKRRLTFWRFGCILCVGGRE
jgi:hypothetical protein